MNSFAIRQDVIQPDQNRLDAPVVAACRLAAQRDDVRSVFVITSERPSFRALMRYRAEADGRGLTLTMLGTGGVVVRRRLPITTVKGAVAASGVRGDAS